MTVTVAERTATPVAANDDQAVRIPGLDGIRAIACLMVVFCHYFVLTWQPGITAPQFSPWLFAMNMGICGVDIFFVLSGFLIGGILLDHRASRKYFSTFYIRRVCRIFPLYYLVLGSFLLAVATGCHRIPDLSNWLFKNPMPFWTYACFVQNIFMAFSHVNSGAHWLGMTWSLAIEEQFYLLLPAIVAFTNRRRLLLLSLACVFAAPIARYIVDGWGWCAYFLLPCRVDSLALGVICACLVRNQVTLHRLQQSKLLLHAALALAAVILCFGYADTVFRHSTHIAFAAVLILIAVVHPYCLTSSILRTRWLVSVGTVSYGLYMFHNPIHGLLHALILHQAPVLHSPVDLTVTLAALVVTFVTAYVSYFGMERHIIACGHRAKWR